MKKSVTFLLLLLLVSCGTTEEIIIQPEMNDQITAVIGDPKDSDPITIKGIRIEENTMMIDIEYTGGCNQHTFELIGSPNIMKSMPPKRSVQLIHDKKNDMCKELINETIEIDIKPLAYKREAGSEIILLVDGVKEGINYIYK